MTKDEAMQQALEALDLHAKQYPHMVKGYTADAASVLRERLAQPEQEQKPMHPEMRKMWEDHFDKCFAESAPQRTWVGLTDEEVRDLWSWSMTLEAELTATTQQHAFARAIEAKLKEKNG